MKPKNLNDAKNSLKSLKKDMDILLEEQAEVGDSLKYLDKETTKILKALQKLAGLLPAKPRKARKVKVTQTPRKPVAIPVEVKESPKAAPGPTGYEKGGDLRASLETKLADFKAVAPAGLPTPENN